MAGVLRGAPEDKSFEPLIAVTNIADWLIDNPEIDWLEQLQGCVHSTIFKQCVPLASSGKASKRYVMSCHPKYLGSVKMDSLFLLNYGFVKAH
jgi:hypothetical protein